MNLQQLRSHIERSAEDDSASESSTTDSGPALRSVADSQAPRQRSVAADGDKLDSRLQEVEMASRLGYLLCQCSWPPQIMVLCDDGFSFRCPRCQRLRDF